MDHHRFLPSPLKSPRRKVPTRTRLPPDQGSFARTASCASVVKGMTWALSEVTNGPVVVSVAPASSADILRHGACAAEVQNRPN